MRLLLARLLAGFFALTWLVFPGFGIADLQVSWDPDWPVVLEASWGMFMSVLVGGAFLAVALAPTRTAPAQATLLVTLAAWLIAAAAGLEWQLLGYVVLLAVQAAALLALLPARERLRPLAWSVSRPLAAVAAIGVVPGLLHAERMFASTRRDAGEIIGELTMGVDHYAVQGALALALPVLAGLAAAWPRGRRLLGLGVGLCAGYVGLVSYAFPASWAGFPQAWSIACMAWGAAVALLALLPARSEPGELRGEVVEAQRAL